MLPGQRRKPVGARPRDGLGEVELVDAFVLAEIGTVVELLQEHQPGALARGFADARGDHFEVGLGAAVVSLLHQGDGEGVGSHCGPATDGTWAGHCRPAAWTVR